MKTTVLETRMSLEEKGLGISVKFESTIEGGVAELLTDEQEEAISKHLSEITKIMNEAIGVNMEKEFEKFIKEEEKRKERVETIDEIQKMLYNSMPEELQREIDEFESKLESFDTDEEKAEYAFKVLMNDLMKTERMMK